MNTEVGLPLTALLCDDSTRTLVAEMGARGRGHIAYLCRLTPPDIAVVLNVGSAHLGEFGSRDNIAASKGEIVEALGPDGVAVLNADDPLVAAMATRTRGRVLTFGHAATADMRIGDLEVDHLTRPSFTLTYGDESAPVTMKVAGEHNAWNAAAAALAGCAAGLPLDAVARALSDATAVSRWRMEISTTPAGVTVVNDAYNANPDSMVAALKSLAEMGRRSPGRTFAVLGEMKELGPDTVAAHDEIGRLIVRLNIGTLVAVGEGARPIQMGAAQEGSWSGEAQYAARHRHRSGAAGRPGGTRRHRVDQGLTRGRSGAGGRGAGSAVTLIILAGGIAMLITLLGTPLLIRLLQRHGYSQAIRMSTDDVTYPEHTGKVGTPSMGGAAMIVAIVVAYLGTHLVFWTWPVGVRSARTVAGHRAGCGGLRRRLPQDLPPALHRHPCPHQTDRTGVRGDHLRGGRPQLPRPAGLHPGIQAVSFVRDTPLVLPMALFVLWIWFLITATTNGVNLTDGLDGLATGAALISFGGYTLMTVWQFNQTCGARHGAQLLSGPRPAGPDGVRRRLYRCLFRVPVVEHAPGPHLHGGHRVTRTRRRHRRTGRS